MTQTTRTQRRTERETDPRDEKRGQAAQPTTREEALREPTTDNADVSDPEMRGSRAGGHAAQDVGSRHQEQEATGPGHGRYHKSDEKPWSDRTPPKTARNNH